MASLRHQVPKHHICLLPQAHNQFVDTLATLASMVKLLEGDDMRKLCIKVYGVPAYCMNIEQCKCVEVEVDRKL